MGRARLVRLGWIAAILGLVLSACAATSGTVRGVVLEVDGSLSDVAAFTVLVEGDRMEFAPSPDGEFSFPLGHLHEHLRTGDPVVVGWELVDGVRLAVSIDDG